MQKQRVDIFKGAELQSTNCFEGYRHMLISSPWTPRLHVDFLDYARRI